MVWTFQCDLNKTIYEKAGKFQARGAGRGILFSELNETCYEHKRAELFFPQVVNHLIRKPGWSTGVVNGKRLNSNGNFHTGFAVPFTVPSDPIRKAWNWSERANGTHDFRSEIPFWNFGPIKSRFPRKFSIWEDQISLSIYIPTEISGFFCKC